MKALVVTNNRMVQERMGGLYQVVFLENGYRQVLVNVRDLVHKGHRLYTHPLSGSIKPNETPYKSVVLSAAPGPLSVESLLIIEESLAACDKFPQRRKEWSEAIKADFQLIDFQLLSTSASFSKHAEVP